MTDGLHGRCQLASLKRRRRDVLRLVALGRSNAEIAADLYPGEATVQTYLSRLSASPGY